MAVASLLPRHIILPFPGRPVVTAGLTLLRGYSSGVYSQRISSSGTTRSIAPCTAESKRIDKCIWPSYRAQTQGEKGTRRHSPFSRTRKHARMHECKLRNACMQPEVLLDRSLDGLLDELLDELLDGLLDGRMNQEP